MNITRYTAFYKQTRYLPLACILQHALAVVLQVTGSMLLQIMRWLKQHGDAALEMEATLLRCPYKDPPLEDQPLQPCSWPRYLHGVNVLPALVPNLQHLSLSCEKGFMIAEKDLFSLQILTQLTSLHLNVASDGSWDMQTMSLLQHLTALKQLGMEVRGLGAGPMILAAELGKLALLTRLSLQQAYSNPMTARMQEMLLASSQGCLDVHCRENPSRVLQAAASGETDCQWAW